MRKITLVLLLLVVIILSSCEKVFDFSNQNNNTDTNDAVDKEIDYSIGITNISDSKNWGDMPALGQPVIFHKISTKKSIFSYDEEVEINVELALNYFDMYHIENGDLHVKIKESEYYEIVGKSEYVIEDFKSEKYCARNDKKYTINFTFIIKPIKQSFKVSTIEFLFKYNYNVSLFNAWENDICNGHSEYRFDFGKEYFFIIKGMYFYNDSENMKLSLSNDDLKSDTLVKDFNNGIIDKQTFYRGMIDSSLLDDIYLIIKDNRINYFSKNLKFQIVFLDQNHEVFKAFSNVELEYYSILLKEKEELEMVKMLLELLNENSKISSEKIDNEIIDIYEEIVSIGNRTYMFDSLKEYNDYADYIFDYVLTVE